MSNYEPTERTESCINIGSSLRSKFGSSFFFYSITYHEPQTTLFVWLTRCCEQYIEASPWAWDGGSLWSSLSRKLDASRKRWQKSCAFWHASDTHAKWWVSFHGTPLPSPPSLPPSLTLTWTQGSDTHSSNQKKVAYQPTYWSNHVKIFFPLDDRPRILENQWNFQENFFTLFWMSVAVRIKKLIRRRVS